MGGPGSGPRRRFANEAEQKRVYYAANREKIIAQCKAWKKRHPEHKANFRKHNLKKQYGITEADYSVMYAQQEGKCAICQEWKEKLSVDHDHLTKRTRALLCNHCNVALGFLKDNPYLARRAAMYLEMYLL